MNPPPPDYKSSDKINTFNNLLNFQFRNLATPVVCERNVGAGSYEIAEP
ncbi:hypothetical protein CFter6_0905 [Collimonas fungivorans]|uniref:Uncharacterized protein n=1 Tax=Collimonas fungivorans TaxID=158899 RepID=A0A127P7B8_9BURK|nr:hypothetical protein CFter6_0905 [Collimonas fungivorans]